MTTYAEIAKAAGFQPQGMVLERTRPSGFTITNAYYCRGTLTLEVERGGVEARWRLTDTRAPLTRGDHRRVRFDKAPGGTVAAGTRMTNLQAALVRLKKEKSK